MTPVEDMSTTRKAARYKGSRPQNQEKSIYAGLVIMPSMNLREHVCAGQRTAAA